MRALADALQRAVAAVRGSSHLVQVPVTNGELDAADWREAVAEHIERHSRERYDRAFLAILDGLGIELRAPGEAAAA